MNETEEFHLDRPPIFSLDPLGGSTQMGFSLEYHPILRKQSWKLTTPEESFAFTQTFEYGYIAELDTVCGTYNLSFDNKGKLISVQFDHHQCLIRSYVSYQEYDSEFQSDAAESLFMNPSYPNTIVFVGRNLVNYAPSETISDAYELLQTDEGLEAILHDESTDSTIRCIVTDDSIEIIINLGDELESGARFSRSAPSIPGSFRNPSATTFGHCVGEILLDTTQ